MLCEKGIMIRNANVQHTCSASLAGAAKLAPLPKFPSCQIQAQHLTRKFCRKDCRLIKQRTLAQQSQAQSSDTDQVATPVNSWQTHLSSNANFAEALQEVIEGCSGRLGAHEPQLALIFVSSAFADQYHEIVPELRKRLPSLTEIAGCSVSKLNKELNVLLCMMTNDTSLHDDAGIKLQGFGVIGNTAAGPSEVEREPGISLSLASLPQVSTRNAPQNAW